MKVLLAMLLVAGAVQSEPALARSSATSPLVGSWTVDVARLPLPPDARPKRVTITFGDAGQQQWTTEVEIVDAAGVRTHTTGTAALDGTPAPVADSPEADTAAVRLPVPGVLIMNLARQGIPASTRVYTVADGGDRMIETAAYVGRDGRPVMRTNYFTRIER